VLQNNQSFSNKRILIVPEYGRFGGTRSFFRRLLAIHSNNNIDTAVLIQKKQLDSEISSIFEKMGIRVFTTPERARFFFHPILSPFYDIPAYLKAARSFRPDLVVVSNATLGIMTGFLILRMPTLFVMHGYPTAKMALPLRIFWRLMSRLNNRFVTVSSFAAETINKNVGIPLESLKVVYNSADCTTRSKKKGKTPVVLTVGHVADHKNPQCWLEVAIRVTAARPDVKFLWLGDGDLISLMKEEISTKRLEDRISFHGFSDKVDDYLSSAAIYFQPSIIESHGIAVIEAMAHGLPCVTSDAGGLPESVLNCKTGFTCPPVDADGFVSHIMELLSDNKLQTKMGNAGRKRAEELFNELSQEREIIDLYRVMLQPNRNINAGI